MRTFEVLVTEEVMYRVTIKAETAAQAKEIAEEEGDLGRTYLSTNARYARVQS